MEFGNRLYELRKKKGLSQEELGNKLNVSRQTVSKYELGEAIPDMEKLVMLSDLFGVSLDELVLGIMPETPSPAPKPFLAAQLESLATEENKMRARKARKILLIALIVMFAIDLLSLVIFLILKIIP